MDIVFKCVHCDQELSVDASGAGSEIECPSCHGQMVIPATGAAPVPGGVVNPIAASAAAKEDYHFSVPQREKKAESLIAKPLKPLEAAAKEGIQLRIRTFKRTDCVEVGHDRFDEIVSNFLEKVGDGNVVSVSPITYSHQELATHAWVTDYGIVIVYRG